MSMVAESLLSDIASEKTGLRHLDGIVGDAKRARKGKWIMKREFDEVLRAVETKRKTIEEAANNPVPIAKEKKQPTLF